MFLNSCPRGRDELLVVDELYELEPGCCAVHAQIAIAQYKRSTRPALEGNSTTAETDLIPAFCGRCATQAGAITMAPHVHTRSITPARRDQRM